MYLGACVVSKTGLTIAVSPADYEVGRAIISLLFISLYLVRLSKRTSQNEIPFRSIPYYDTLTFSALFHGVDLGNLY